MNLTTGVKQHDWKLLTMTDVVVIGADPESGEPIGLKTGDTREGVNCGDCGIPWFPENEDTSCEPFD